MLKNRFVKFMLYFIGISLVVNIILAFITYILPVKFTIPKSLLSPAKVFFTLHIWKYNLMINQTIVNTWVIMILLTLILYFGTRNLSVDNPGTLQLILENIYNFVDYYFLGNFRTYKKRFMPFFSAMFSMLLLCNLSSFLAPYVFMVSKEDGSYSVEPFFRNATADVNTTVGLALVVFVMFIAIAIAKKGLLGFLKELSQPFILMFPMNVLGEFAKPINISMRLFGNMMAGIVMVALLYGIHSNTLTSLITGHMFKSAFSFSLLWAGFLQLYIDLFVGVIQAFIFTVLSSVYVEQALFGLEGEEN